MNKRYVWLGVATAAALLATRAGAEDEAAKPAPTVQELSDRLDELEVKGKDAVVAGDIPGSFRIPGTDVSLHLYGFAEMNWVHDFKSDNSDIDYSTFSPYLPLDDTPGGNRTNRDYFTARTSRIGLDAATPTKWGVLAVKVEGDFNNEPRTGNTALYGTTGNVYTQQSTNSYGFRIRHAYGQFGGLLIGQTWSTFMDVDNLPETVDFNGPVGATFIRQAQIRFAYATVSAGTFTAALENSSTYVLDGRESSNEFGVAMSTSLSAMPDVVLRWDKGFEWGALSARGVTQQLRLNDGAGAYASKRGYGAAASGSLKVRGDADLVMVQVTGGHGIGRYLNYIEGAVYDGSDIRLENALGFVVGYACHPADWVRVNASFSATVNFDNDYVTAIRNAGLDRGRFGINRWVWQGHFGPIFSPLKSVDLGFEGIVGHRTTLAGEQGSMVRLDFSAKYYIN